MMTSQCPAEILLRQEGRRETGGWLWEAARVLEDALLEERRDWSGLRVLELGSGSGWLALRLASLGAEVTATDRKGMLALLSRNVAINQRRWLDKEEEEGLQVEVEELDWDNLDTTWSLDDGGPHLIIGSDLVYLHENHPPLLRALTYLSSRGARCVLSWEERKPVEEEQLIALADQMGFDCRLLHERVDTAAEELWDGRHDGKDRRLVVWELLQRDVGSTGKGSVHAAQSPASAVCSSDLVEL
jgi:predicted nicotinamide N-methyase